MVDFEHFEQLDIRVGTVVEARTFDKARKPAYQLVIDFGPEAGMRKSSAQITDLYTTESLLGTQVIAVCNFPPRQIANFVSEVLVLGIYTPEGVTLLRPDTPCQNGAKIG